MDTAIGGASYNHLDPVVIHWGMTETLEQIMSSSQKAVRRSQLTTDRPIELLAGFRERF